ncbi:hypothetical protein [Pinibacter soli]|uniref:Uncharacterized protein n=1 Tax=Pinibacter soli TaxID=3044211 RepID=A0ABT6RAB3_9BACT|nr:hypothetical protein [Pinibacter soli]MDI3319493.1 hypothetical protein [Pinibacter soli]
MRKLFILLLCLISFSVKSQSLEDMVSNEIISLHKKGVDTIVQFTDGCCAPAVNVYKIPGLGEVMVAGRSYLFYKLHGVGMVTKCIYYSDNKGEKINVATLNPLKIECDSLLSFASASFQKFRQEKIYPFIYEWKHDGDSSYVWLHGFDRTYYYVGIETNNESERKIVDPDDVEKLSLNGEAENLNYRYNSNTSIYKIYLTAQRLIEPIERKFIYGRK